MDKPKKVVLVLIKPSQYDGRDHNLHRYLRGVLPSNSLGVMYALTLAALQTLGLKIPVEVHVFEDGIVRHARKLKSLYRRFAAGEPDTKLIVGLVAVQTAQFPRAADLIEDWQKVGATCIIGGFHVSGLMRTLYYGVSHQDFPSLSQPAERKYPADIQWLLDRGVSVFVGEAEGVWSKVLGEIIDGIQKPIYENFAPDISRSPLAIYPDDYLKNSFSTSIRTYDFSRGCPYDCGFCAIWPNMGRRMRSRSARMILERIRSDADRNGRRLEFFATDDNFAANPARWDIMRGLIALRVEGYDVRWMTQVDIAFAQMDGPNGESFLEMGAAAGLEQIFQGAESPDPAVLRDLHKRSNIRLSNNDALPEDELEEIISKYQKFWNKCREVGIAVHATLIVNNPKDTPESMHRNILLYEGLGADQISAFWYTYLVGSVIYAKAVSGGVRLNPNWSCYDSYHQTGPHPILSEAEQRAALNDVWRTFYSTSNMVLVLKRQPKHLWTNLWGSFVWIWNSVFTEKTHPMIAGFFRVKSYDSFQRYGRTWNNPSRKRFFFQECWRYLRYVGKFIQQFFIFQHVTTESCRDPKAKKVGWWRRTFSRRYMSREWLNNFWIDYGRQKWQLLNPLKVWWHIRAIPKAISEIVYATRFGRMMIEFVQKKRGK